MNNNLDNLKEELERKESQLNLLYEKKINGIVIRAKAIDIEGNEKNTKYFANLEKKRPSQNIYKR